MGILDKKTRFIDLVVTQEGRRQIAAGKLRAEFASLSDCNAFYDEGERDSVANRLYFEVAERPENSIVLEKDDSGKIINFNSDPKITVLGEFLFSSSLEQKENTSDLTHLVAATGSQFASVFAELTGSSLKHFKNNYFIGTNNPLDQNNFEINRNEMVFQINNQQPFNGSPLREIIDVDDAEPFFIDPKLTHLPNFKFLPPVNTDGSNYGTYSDIRSTSRETWQDISARLGIRNSFSSEFVQNIIASNPNLSPIIIGANVFRPSSSPAMADFDSSAVYESQNLLINGMLPTIQQPSKQSHEINFLKTSEDNNLLIQVYEDGLGAAFQKLDIIDAGIFEDPLDKENRFNKQVFYVGKIFFDSFNAPTFINIFTIIMD